MKSSRPVLGLDPLADGSTWDNLYEQSARRRPGTDMRALSAVDLVLWDLRCNLLRVPVYVLLGGSDTPDGVRVYNTCAGSNYANATRVGTGRSQERDDLWRAMHTPAELAAELRMQGFAGMKIWPFDAAAIQDQGRRIAPAVLRAGIEILTVIRAEVGDRFDLMIEGHGQWQVAAATTILGAVEPLDIRWAEDMI